MIKSNDYFKYACILLMNAIYMALALFYIIHSNIYNILSIDYSIIQAIILDM